MLIFIEKRVEDEQSVVASSKIPCLQHLWELLIQDLESDASEVSLQVHELALHHSLCGHRKTLCCWSISKSSRSALRMLVNVQPVRSIMCSQSDTGARS